MKVDGCQAFFSKTFSQKFLDLWLVKCKDSAMTKNWIPRSQRWTVSERAQKRIDAMNRRELSRLFWLEKQKFRDQIFSEIEQKILAKRAAIE